MPRSIDAWKHSSQVYSALRSGLFGGFLGLVAATAGETSAAASTRLTAHFQTGMDFLYDSIDLAATATTCRMPCWRSREALRSTAPGCHVISAAAPASHTSRGS